MLIFAASFPVAMRWDHYLGKTRIWTYECMKHMSSNRQNYIVEANMSLIYMLNSGFPPIPFIL